MFVGHYAAAIAAKAVEPRGPLWTYVAGCQLLDIVWGLGVATGLEKVRFDPALPGNPFDLAFMPYSHSLSAALVWSVLALIAARYLLRLPWTVAMVVGGVVLSHWVLDLIVHRPDLEVWPGGPQAGFGLWNLPLMEMVLEVGLVALAAIAWTSCLKSAGSRAVTAFAFVAILIAIQLLAGLPIKTDPGAVAVGVTAVIASLVITGLSLLFDRPRPRWSLFRR